MNPLRIILMSAGGGVILVAALGGFGSAAIWAVMGGVLLVILAAFAKDGGKPQDDAEFAKWKAQREAAQRKDWEKKINQ